MATWRKIIAISLLLSFTALQIFAAPDPNFHMYLLFGQSNMAGGCNGGTATPESIDILDTDCDTTSRVKLLAFNDFSNYKSNPCGSFTMNREHNKWYTAYPPYHNCSEGIGPADYFGKILLDSIREDIRIGFIPCALSGQAIEMFMKGRMSQVPDWCNSYLSQQGNVSVYDWMRERLQLSLVLRNRHGTHSLLVRMPGGHLLRLPAGTLFTASFRSFSPHAGNGNQRPPAFIPARLPCREYRLIIKTGQETMTDHYFSLSGERITGRCSAGFLPLIGFR